MRFRECFLCMFYFHFFCIILIVFCFIFADYCSFSSFGLILVVFFVWLIGFILNDSLGRKLAMKDK